MTKTPTTPIRPATWSNAVELFTIHLTEAEKSPNTIRAYQSDLMLFQSWYVSTYQETPALDLVSAAELRAWKGSMTEAKQAPQTINRRLAAIQSLIRFGATQEWCQTVAGPRTVRQETPRPRWLSRREQLALVRIVERSADRRDIALIKLMLHAGLRIAEAESTRWSSLELSPRKGSITIIGKGRKQRTIPLNVEARNALLDLSGNVNTGQTRIGRDLPVFRGREGGLTANALWRIVTSYGEKAKLEGFSPHVLRHTFCRRLAEAGVRLEEIAALAGHESIETTRRYVEPGEDDLRAAVERLAAGDD
jgi:integrase/recombinase XerC